MYDINLHCHSLLSDGVLLPSEIAMRYLAAGYKTIAITDHADYSNIDNIIKSTLEFVRNWPSQLGIKVLPGIELTHLPLEQFKPLAKLARDSGIKIIIAHGETVVEPVIKGTNSTALEADIDILAHPGLVTKEEAEIAKKKGIFLEITTRLGHSNTNAHVVEQALKVGAGLILNHDSHQPQDIISPEESIKFAKQAGLDNQAIDRIFQHVKFFSNR